MSFERTHNRGDMPRRCINCSLVIHITFPVHSLDELSNSQVNTLSSWIAPSSITSGSILCEECFAILARQSISENAIVPSRQYGHGNVCFSCGNSILRQKSYRVAAECPERNVILRWTPPHQVSRLERVCGACWQSAKREIRRQAQHDVNRGVLTENVSSIVPVPPPLPPPLVMETRTVPVKITSSRYKRAAATANHCVFIGCQSSERLLVPKTIRDMSLIHNRLYIPSSARVCSYHLYIGCWSDLTSNLNDFTAVQFDNILKTFEDAHKYTFNFENISTMLPHLCHYWLGKTYQEFEELLLCVPTLAQHVKNPSMALCIYLVKLRTGESNERLSTLFQIPRSTLERKMNIARRCLTEEFVPRNLGFEHMDVEQVAARNRIIPEGLFGNPILPEDVKPAIVMCDATYIFVQHSSNYQFQKKTYSTQKLDNLVKPFMIVCCDGYIIECLGPYKATSNDATITRHDLICEESKLREFFRPGDIFILDRGFRDAIPLLEEIGFEAKMPESLLEGEHQLSTLQANKSRFVTMCRWVVEIVNGRIKRDFRLFRDVFNNRAATHLKEDFRIACALLNKFHKVIENPTQAQKYVEIAQSRLNLRNHLAEFVENENLNRRRAIFTPIDGHHPHLNCFPMLSLDDLKRLALGTYQIKQARSYYGEHIRSSGTYSVEINSEIDDDVPLILGLNNYLIRGRIKSRHVGGRTYFTYVLVNCDISNVNTLNAIVGYCCNCLIGKRTVGCCAHVMTSIWYLSWGRHNDINAPAPFLDDFFEYDDV